MSDRSVEIEDPGEWPGLPADDPRRRELEAKPSARARVLAYREFMAAENLPGAPGRAEAETRLAAALDAEIGIPGATAGASDGAPARATLAAPEARLDPRPFAWFGPSRFKPLVAIAAVVLAMAGAGLVTTVLRQQQGDPLRGIETPGVPGVWSPDPKSRVTPNAGLALAWTAAPGADRYVVVFVSADLEELDRIEGITSLELILTREALPRGLRPATTVSWRVLAFRGADEIGRSPATPVTLP